MGRCTRTRRVLVTVVLRGGESLDVDNPRYDETGRFQLILQSDGNLVLYAHCLQPNPSRFATGQSGTGGGADRQLHLNESGVLVLRLKSDPSEIVWKMPHYVTYSVGTHPGGLWIPYGRKPVAGSTLHLQSDGNLVLYTPSMRSNEVTWSMGTLLQDLDPDGDPNARKVVAANALILSIPNGNVSPSGSTVIQNSAGKPIEVVTPNQRPVQVPPGGYATVQPSGGLPLSGSLSLPQYKNPGDPPGADAVFAQNVPLPAGAIVSVAPTAGGFGLAGI
jgi:hypothetical protein